MIILHIVGAPFTGKTTFIQTYLPHDVVFDIRKLYEQNPTFVSMQQTNYDAFQKLVHASMKEHVNLVLKNYAETSTKGFLVVESSGYNKAINNYVARFPNFTILLETPEYIITARIYKYLRDVGENKVPRVAFDPFESLSSFYRACAFNSVVYHIKYFTDLDKYYPTFDIVKARRLLSDEVFKLMLQTFQ